MKHMSSLRASSNHSRESRPGCTWPSAVYKCLGASPAWHFWLQCVGPRARNRFCSAQCPLALAALAVGLTLNHPASPKCQTVGPPAASTTAPAVRVDLDQAIQMALAHNHALLAQRNTVQQSQAEEITANLRPNPVITADSLLLPIFSPNQFGSGYVTANSESDAGVSYLIERGHKRQARLRAAQDVTRVTRTQVADAERNLKFGVAQQFIGVLLAQSTLDFARQDLKSFQNTVNISQAQYKAGDISEGDFLKIKLQLLQFQTDVSSAEVALVQARAGLRLLTGYEALPENFEAIGDLAYKPIPLSLMDLQARALRLRPDLIAAQQGVTAAQSQYGLARANGKRDLTLQVLYSRLARANDASFFGSMELPIFDRNQGEVARTHFAITQAQELQSAFSDQVMTDVRNAYESYQTNAQVAQLYASGYLKAAQDSRDISEYAYKRGAASLLDFLDAERSYRATQLAYRQALAAFMVSVEQVRQAVGTRNLP